MLIQAVLMVSGIFAILGAIGTLRFPDFYTRSHAATMTSVGGVGLAMLALMFSRELLGAHFFKTLIIIIIMLLTGPTAQHAIASRAHSSGIRPVSRDREEKR